MSKFKNEEELLKAYQSLEKEFTKKSQKLAILEKSAETKNLKIILDSAIEHYDQLAKEYAVIKTIECLISVQKYVSDNAVYIEEEQFAREINDFIDQKISELKGE